MITVFEEYIKRRIKRLKGLLNSFQKTQDQETLHRIRVEIKKIKAVLQLMHFNDKKLDERKEFLPFRKIFRACGKIREPYVSYSLAVKFGGKPLPQAPDCSELIQEFRKDIPKYVRSVKEQKKHILKKAGDIQSLKYKKYLEKKETELEKMLVPKFRLRELHQVRKLIKEILSIMTIFSKKQALNPFFDDIADLIGNWHDKVIFIAKLKKKGSRRLALMKKLQQESRADLKELRAEIRKFFYKNK